MKKGKEKCLFCGKFFHSRGISKHKEACAKKFAAENPDIKGSNIAARGLAKKWAKKEVDYVYDHPPFDLFETIASKVAAEIIKRLF